MRQPLFLFILTCDQAENFKCDSHTALVGSKESAVQYLLVALTVAATAHVEIACGGFLAEEREIVRTKAGGVHALHLILVQQSTHTGEGAHGLCFILPVEMTTLPIDSRYE